MSSDDASDSNATGGLDLVTICILAVNRLAPATLRSSVSGKALKVVVPDPQVGAVFRAALDRMGVTRSTDRLIEIVVDRKARPS
jgi:hypothetical protein